MDPSKSRIDIAMSCFEPNANILDQDLKELASYLIKIGSDVNIVLHNAKRNRLLKHTELDSGKMEQLIAKYKLTWVPDRDKDASQQQNPLQLHNIAHNYPKIFIGKAALLSPGGYEERRFWWCANNYDFYLKYRDQLPKEKYSTSRLLCDSLCQVLTMKEQKLITINALHLSVKHSEPQIFFPWFHRNREIIFNVVRKNYLEVYRPQEKYELRKLFRIAEAESELNHIDVDLFVEWWNLTGLRRF